MEAYKIFSESGFAKLSIQAYLNDNNFVLLIRDLLAKGLVDGSVVGYKFDSSHHAITLVTLTNVNGLLICTLEESEFKSLFSVVLQML